MRFYLFSQIDRLTQNSNDYFLQSSRSGNQVYNSELEELHAAHNEAMQARLQESKQRQEGLERELKAARERHTARTAGDEQTNGA